MNSFVARTFALGALLASGTPLAADFTFLNRLSPASEGFLGRTLALNDGFAFAGAPQLNVGQGGVWLFQNDSSGLTLVRQIPARAKSPRRFGGAISSSGEWTAIGYAGGTDQIDLFRRVGSDWVFVESLFPPDPSQLGGIVVDRFGSQISLRGDRLIVGDASADIQGGESNVGAALIFARNAGGTNAWGVEDVVVSPSLTPDGFASGVAIDGSTALVAESGLQDVHVFTRSGSSWNFTRTLAPIDSEVNDGFGDCANSNSGCLAIDGDLVAVGANSGNETVGLTAGSVHVFSRNQGGSNQWGQIAQVLPSTPFNIDVFGQDVKLAEDLLFVSAPGNQANRVFVFQRSGPVFNEVQIIEAPTDVPTGNVEFGSTLAYEAGALIVGSERWDDNPDRFGAVMSYRSPAIVNCGTINGIFCDRFED